MARRLRPDEEALWRRVISGDRPLRPKDTTARVKPPPRTDGAFVPPTNPPAPAAPFRIGERAVPAKGREPARAPLRIDRRMQTRLTRGKMAPEARIDLHGMTLDEAHHALTRFVLASFATGRRLVLVITGKGRGGETSWDGSRGILRRQVPDWLARPPLASVVQEIVPAHRSHGGAGAFYIILRRA